MADNEGWQLTRSTAEVYEEYFIPALFGQWPPRVADAARIEPGQRVLDVACGTGVLTREVARRVTPGGSVVGLDLSEGMLEVARREAPGIEFRQGSAERLPFENGSFDTVVSQFGLMIFSDRCAAVSEMVRVLRPSGRLAVAVWDSLENTPGYAAVTGLLKRLFGDRLADELRVPFSLGDTQLLASIFVDAGVPDIEITTTVGTARFPSIGSWMYTDVKGWTLSDKLDDAQYARLAEEAESALRKFVVADGEVRFGMPAHIVTAMKRCR